MIITSLDNKEIKYLDKLKQRKYRDREKKYIIEGQHLVEEAYKNNVLEKIFILEDYNNNLDIECVTVSSEVMKKISTLDSISNVIGLCKIINEEEVGNKVLVLDSIQDPGNLGTMIRSSVAFNFDTIILSENTVDLYNPKVVRATQGMLFKINIIRRNLKELIINLKNQGYDIYTTDVNDGENIKDIDVNNKFLLIMGNEGNGVRKEISSLANHKIYIPMNSEVESLNVGVAASILMYEMGNKNE